MNHYSLTQKVSFLNTVVFPHKDRFFHILGEFVKAMNTKTKNTSSIRKGVWKIESLAYKDRFFHILGEFVKAKNTKTK